MARSEKVNPTKALILAPIVLLAGIGLGVVFAEQGRSPVLQEATVSSDSHAAPERSEASGTVAVPVDALADVEAEASEDEVEGRTKVVR